MEKSISSSVTIIFSLVVILCFSVVGSFQNVDAKTLTCPSISNWVLYTERFFDDKNLFQCEYEPIEELYWERGDEGIMIQWISDPQNYPYRIDEEWCSNSIIGHRYSSPTHYLIMIYGLEYTEIVTDAKNLEKHFLSMNIAATCTATSPTPTPKTEKTAYDWNETGRELQNQERYNEAIDAYEKAISIDPNYKWAWYNKGLVLNDLEKYENAIVVLNQVLRIDPNYEGAYFEKGYALGELGRHEEAIPVYLKELQLDPTDKWALNNLGWGLNELGRYEEALSYLDRSLKIDPNNTLAIDNKKIALEKLSKQEAVQAEYGGWIKQGSDHLKNGNFDEAIKNFDLAYKQNPNDQNLINLKADALKKKGMALVDEGKFDLGIVFLGESNHLKSDDSVKALQNNAYNKWAEEIKKETVVFDPKIRDAYKLLDHDELFPPPLPTVGKGSSDTVNVHRLTDPDVPLIDYSGARTISGTTLNVGDIIFVPPNDPPFIIDWGHATTTVKPGSVFLIGTTADLQTFAKGNPHYIELVEGQLRLYKVLTKDIKLSEKVCFNLKTEKNLNRACGTDVTISHDKTTGVFSIQIDHGTIQVYDVITDEIKEYGVGTKLVTNNDGYYLVEQAAAQLDETVETPSGGGCLIATATFGTELAPEVQQLRELRDNTLLQTESGSSFMSGFNQFYYSFSPTIADWERQNPIFKETVKVAITPLIASLSILNYVDIDSEAEVLGYGISLILLNIGMYFVLPAIVIHRVKKSIMGLN